MERISSSTPSAILFESFYFLDGFENERIYLYKSLKTANNIYLFFDLVEKRARLSAILPIDRVNATKPIDSPGYLVFPEWVGAVQIDYNVGFALWGGYMGGDNDANSDDNDLIWDAVQGTATVSASSLFVAAAQTIAMQESAKPEIERTKSIQITLDEPNLKAIVEADIPFEISGDKGTFKIVLLD